MCKKEFEKLLKKIKEIEEKLIEEETEKGRFNYDDGYVYGILVMSAKIRNCIYDLINENKEE